MAQSFLTSDTVKISDKVKLFKIHSFWFTDVVNNGMALNYDNVYTISEINQFSSWTSVRLKETGDKEYSLGFFIKF